METQATYQKSSKVDSSDCRLEWLVLSQRPLLKAYLGDCMDLMASTADNYYDLAIVDPPYGIGASDYQRGGTQYGNSVAKCKTYTTKDWDKEIPSLKYFTELRRVSKNQIIWGGNYFELYPTPCFVVWDKDNGNNGYADCELAWTSFKTAVRKFTWKWQGMLQQNMADKEHRIHPTQKPVALYRWLLQNYAKAGQRILDTHGGSFSSAVACHMEGFEMDICEIDKEYFDAGVKRFKENTCQLKMF